MGKRNRREPSVNFLEQPKKRRTYGSTRGRSNSSSYVTGDKRPRGLNIRGSSSGNRPTSNERPTQDDATGRRDSVNWGHAYQGRSHPRDSKVRENLEPISVRNYAQTGHSRAATAFETLNRSLETFLTRLSETSERSEETKML